MQAMRRLTLSLLFCGHVCWADSASIVTWNLEWFPGHKPTSTPSSRVLHMSAAKEALLGLSPDVLCVQEMRNWDSFAELTSVVPRLKPLVVSAHQDSPEGGAISIQQIGIAAIFPAIGAWSEAFAQSEHSPPRGFSFVALDVGEGKRLLVYSVHLKSNLGELPENIARREDGARQVIEHAAKMERDYAPTIGTIVCGDFNTDPTDVQFAADKTFQLFTEAGFQWPWKDTPREQRITHPGDGRYPPASFDHFLVRGEVTVVSCRPLNSDDSVSDHKPVELVVSW